MLMDNNQFVLDRRQIIRRKVLAIGRMSRAYQVLKTNPELVRQLKSVSIDGKLPSGILSGGEQAMKEAILSSSAINHKSMLQKQKEQKDHTITFYACPTINYKIMADIFVTCIIDAALVSKNTPTCLEQQWDEKRGARQISRSEDFTMERAKATPA